jgi:hypothetical protein
MPRKLTPNKLVERLIEETFRGYIAAAKNRTFLLEMSYMGLDMGRWNEKAQSAMRFGAIISRVCGGISQELQNLYAIEERLHQKTGQDLRLVIEHVESPWRPEYAKRPEENATQNGAPTQPHTPDTGQSEA